MPGKLIYKNPCKEQLRKIQYRTETHIKKQRKKKKKQLKLHKTARTVKKKRPPQKNTAMKNITQKPWKQE